MIIRTTANIDKEISGRISGAAKTYGISVQQIINVLLKILIKEKPLKFRLYRAVEYQSRRDKDRWECIHLELSGVVYEASIDLRKLMKLSVSYLLSHAVEVYLERAVEEILRGEAPDNYPENYTIFIRHSSKRSTFTIFHTVPDPNDYPEHLKSTA